MLAAVAGMSACSTAPRVITPRETTADAPILVATLPPGGYSVPRGPFDDAPPDMQAASRLVGCYAVTLGPWSRPQAPGVGIPTPARVELLSERHTRIYIGFGLVARTPGFSGSSEAFPAAWSPIGADSLQVRAWANGTSSTFFFLRRLPDRELRGSARYFSDAHTVDSTGRWMWETYPSAPASLRPTSCDSSGD